MSALRIRKLNSKIYCQMLQVGMDRKGEYDSVFAINSMYLIYGALSGQLHSTKNLQTTRVCF
jgi:hypothetical protein